MGGKVKHKHRRNITVDKDLDEKLKELRDEGWNISQLTEDLLRGATHVIRTKKHVRLSWNQATGDIDVREA